MKNLLIISILFVIAFFTFISVFDVYIYSEPRWAIGLYDCDSTFTVKEMVNNPILSKESLKNKMTVFVADPYVFEENGVQYLFYEQGNIRNGKWIGEIAYATSNDGNSYRNDTIIFADKVSLSFPIVYKIDSEYYMSLESAGAKNVRLLKAKAFPNEWVVSDTLLEGRYSDPVLFHKDDLWYLFVSSNNNQETHLYYSNNIKGPYLEHVKSPIVTNNKRLARNAGSIFSLNNRLYRPVQDCSNLYGEKVRLMEILEITKDSYSERESDKSPILQGSGKGWNKKKMHTFNVFGYQSDSYKVITDGTEIDYKNQFRIKLKKVLKSK
jgi:hypothetical protein